jgi:peptide deformylase
MPDEPILPIDHPLLSRPSEPIEKVDYRVRELAEVMFAVMDSARGAGLAAVQIGQPIRLIVMDIVDAEGVGHRKAMVNPAIVVRSECSVVRQEGCLSMPGYDIPVPRHEWVVVEFQDIDGRYRSLTATGPLAVCVQHEVDHTNGVLFYDRVSRLRRQRAREHFCKIRRRYATDR